MTWRRLEVFKECFVRVWKRKRYYIRHLWQLLQRAKCWESQGNKRGLIDLCWQDWGHQAWDRGSVKKQHIRNKGVSKIDLEPEFLKLKVLVIALENRNFWKCWDKRNWWKYFPREL